MPEEVRHMHYEVFLRYILPSIYPEDFLYTVVFLHV